MSEAGGPEQQLSRKQIKKVKRDQEIAKAQQEAKFRSRRSFLKAVTPGGWIPEVIKAGGVDKLSTAAKVSIVKDAALLLGGTNIVHETLREKTLKEKVLAFTWKEAEDPAKLKAFMESMADGYLELTKTERLKKQDLVEENRTNFYKNTDGFMQSIREVEPHYDPPETQWGYTDFASKRVFIDLEKLKRQAQSQGSEAGLALIDGLWHEWGHLDVTPRETGELINNKEVFFQSPVSGNNEQFKSYRGGTVYTDTYFGYRHFDEVWNETITLRRMIEQVGLDQVDSTADYYENGVDFFPQFTATAKIPLETLYEMHATSDFEGLAKLVGENLPGEGPSINKGVRLFTGIHQSNPDWIRDTGVYDVISSAQTPQQ